MASIRVVNGTGDGSSSLYLLTDEASVATVAVANGPKPRIVLTRFGEFVGIHFEQPVKSGDQVELDVKDINGSDMRAEFGGFVRRGSTPIPFYPTIGGRPFVDSGSQTSPRAFMLEKELDPDGPEMAVLQLEILSLRCPSLSDRVFRAAWFFWYLDVYTNPPFLGSRYAYLNWGGRLPDHEVKYRCSAIGDLMAALTSRVSKRLALAKAGVQDPLRVRAEVRAATKVDLHCLAHFAAIQCTLMTAFFSDPGGGFLVNELADAFQRFSAGELLLSRRIPQGSCPHGISQGSPDSAAHFFFAEFALLALDFPWIVGDTFWGRVLPVFVGAQRLFKHAYGDPSRPLPASTYEDCGNRAPRLIDAQVLNSWYSAIKLDDADALALRMGENLKQTFAGGFLGTRGPYTGGTGVTLDPSSPLLSTFDTPRRMAM